MMARLRARWSMTLLLAAYLVLATAYSVANPLHEATDELRHYRFVRTIATIGRLPVQGQEPCRSQSHHPPLFYALGALATFWIDTGRDICYTPPENPFWAYRYWEVGRDNKNQFLHGPDEAFPWSGEALAAHLIRLINILIGAGVVWLAWATGRTVWPRRLAIAWGAAALVAFNPMFLYMAGAINNDIIAAFSGAAVLYACLRLVNDANGLGRRWGIVVGSLFGLALLSKFNLAATIVLIEAAVTWVAWRRGQWRQWWQTNLWLAITVGLLAGWWFVRNQMLYGEPTGFETVTELWGVRDPGESLPLAISELPYAWTTLWGRFGFGQIPLPQIIYDGLLALTLAGLVGAVIGFVRQARDRLSLLFLGATILIFFAVLFNYMLVSPAGPNGRFFFPALTALALLTFYGLSQWLAWPAQLLRPGRPEAASTANPILAGLTGLGMLALALAALTDYLVPAYARPPALPEQAAIPNPTNARFDSLVTLLGYELSSDSLLPGEPLDISLYWEVNNRPPGDYLLFVHLIDEVATMVGQRDTHPGLGNFPASQWQPGDRFVDTIRLYVPETAYAPAQALIHIGLYAPDAYRLGITGPEGQGLGDALALGQVALNPWPGDYPNAQRQNFNNEIRLSGYEYSQRQVRPGDTADVTLYWQALQDGPADYLVQVRLLATDGTVVAQADSRPQGGSAPTAGWQTGDMVQDTHRLVLDPSLPAGNYTVEIALFDPVTGRRQNIVGEDGHWIDSRVLLAQLNVLP
jgi:hypothetical protein